jgi:lipid II:glycine glycyltransferase (peptidoglycan interpeptide bridge formation enzyme)
MPQLQSCEDPRAWDAFVAQAADGALLQAWAWGELKARHGWTVARYFWEDAATPRCAISVLRRQLPGGLALHYAPRGPILDGQAEEWPGFWSSLKEQLSRDQGTILKVDPEWDRDSGGVALLERVGGLRARHPIQHQATIVVDISGGEQAFARLKESTRRNIRAGERAGIVVEASDSTAAMETFYDLLTQTAERRTFTIRSAQYYQDLLEVFRERGQVAIYLARLKERLLAGAVMMTFGPTLLYLYGGTASDASELKPGYLLHWRAIQDAQRRGCVRYDMFGVPLDPRPGQRGYGYYTFKTRFNGTMRRFVGLYDLPVSRLRALPLRLAERFVAAGRQEFV